MHKDNRTHLKHYHINSLSSFLSFPFFFFFFFLSFFLDSTSVTSLLKGTWTVGGRECVLEGGIISLGTRSLKKKVLTHTLLIFLTIYSQRSLFSFSFFGVLTFFCGNSGFYPVFTCNKMFY